MADFVIKHNFAPIKNVLIKIHVEWDAPCFPKFKSFIILILSITVWPLCATYFGSWLSTAKSAFLRLPELEHLFKMAASFA